MNYLETLVAAWCSFGWLSLLAFTASVLLIAALRKPCRKVFGAERAFLLWLLPPAAVLACLLPHAATDTSSLPPVIVTLTTLPAAVQSGTPAGGIGDRPVWIAVYWLVGVLATLSLAVFAQVRYRAKLRGALQYGGELSRWPILRAIDSSTGPALVGAWRPCIVVPADFDDRYECNERALILAHEAMHARRLDGWWCLAAQVVTALFWFHPLAWWALSALRRDQELACDAGVLRENRGRRRSYANAMLKTQSAAFALPVGCAWSPRHPITERIAMLKRTQPGRVRRASGVVLMGAVILLGAGVAYAATAPATENNPHAGRYALKVVISHDGKPAHLRADMCLKPGGYYTVNQHVIAGLPSWHGQFSVVPTDGGLLEVRADMDGGPFEHPESPRLRTRPGQTATIILGADSAGKPDAGFRGHTIRIDLTPSVGC